VLVEIDPSMMAPPTGPLKKRWYREGEKKLDLFIWLNDAEEIVRSQLFFQDEVLDWNRENGIKTGILESIDGGFSNLSSSTFSYHDAANQDQILEMTQVLKDSEREDLPIIDKVLQLFKIS